MGHDLLVAALQEEEADQDPEQAEEAEHGAQVDAVVTAHGEEVHPQRGEQLGEAAEEDGDVAQGPSEFLVVSAFHADTELFQTETDDSGEETKQADGFGIDCCEHRVNPPLMKWVMKPINCH